MVGSSSANPANIKKAIKFLIKRPDMKVPQAMRLIRFSNKEVANLSWHHFIQQSLPGKTMKGLKALLTRRYRAAIIKTRQSALRARC